MTSPTRVLMTLHRAARAGTERHVLWLVQELTRRGWEVSLVVSCDGPLLAGYREAAAAVYVLPRRGRLDPWYVSRLASVARRTRCQVLHAHSGRIAVLAGRLAGVAVVIETRHGLGAVGDPPGGIRMWREAAVCRLAHRTVTVCENDRRRLITGGLDEKRVVWIPNGVPPLETSGTRGRGGPETPEGLIKLGFLGRVSPEKNPLFLIDVVKELDRRAPNRWQLLIAGDGPLRNQLARGLASFAGEGRVVWLGETDGPGPLLRQIDYLLVPSFREGQPLGILEAMQAGVVVIARKLPSMDEILGGETAAGLLLEGGAADWGDAILRLADPDGPARSLAAEGVARAASRHSLARMVDAVEDLYRQSFEAHRGCW